MTEIQRHISSWVKTHARPLEQSIVLFLLGQGTKEAALKALMGYQYPNGGFGHGLEPDCLNPMPSPIQTWFATHYIKILGLEGTHPIVKSCLDYLSESIDHKGMFDTVLPSNNDYPHAPWWHDRVTNRRWGYNPTASLLGFMFRYLENTSLIGWINQAIRTFLSYETYEMHELVCFVELYDSIRDQHHHFCDFKRFEHTIKEALINLAGDPKVLESQTYGARPSTFCQRPDMLGCDVLHDVLALEVTMMSSYFRRGGIPQVTWQWGQYEEAFKASMIAWQGILMMNALMLLKAFKEA
jgi:hypothetical protein